MRKTKTMLAVIIALIMVISFIPFKAFATGSYTLIFSVNTAQGQSGEHTITIDQGHLKIDGQFVDPKLASDPTANFNGFTVAQNAQDATKYEMTITGGETVVLNFYSNNAYDLFAGGQPVGPTTEFSSTTDIAVQDYSGNTGSFNVNFGTASWTIGEGQEEVTVTASIANKTINTSTVVAVGENDEIALTNFDQDTMEVRVTEIVTGTNQPFSTTLSVSNGVTKLANHDPEVNLPENLEFAIVEKQSGPIPGQFDGNAYFVWLNDDDEVCYHKFENLFGIDQNGGYPINYINVTELTDQSGNNNNFTFGQEPANWVLAIDMEDNQGNVKPEALNPEYIFGDGQYDMGVQLDPTGAIDGASSLCTNGNRAFRATIYKQGYQALQFSDDTEDYTYFPSFWDPTFFSSTVDISGTTAENPAEYSTYLLESTIRFVNAELSENNITNVEALDVNPNAVEIRQVDGIWIIKFNSNYYDNVVFKVTAGQKTYYVKINRIVLNVLSNFRPDQAGGKLLAQLYYPSSKSYNDYEIVATVIDKDGKSKTEKLSATKITEELGDPRLLDEKIDDYTAEGGKGLKSCVFAIDVEDKTALQGVYFTVINKGALEGDTYGGTFSGSGEGTYYNAEERKIEL